MEILARKATWLALVILLATPAYAQNFQLAEQKIKVGMLYNFLKYTDWPAADAARDMAVCIYGDDPFSGNLQSMQGRSVNQRSIVIRSLSDVAEAASCHLIVIDADKKDTWPQLRAALAGKPVLTVSEYPGFAQAGGMIEFGHRDNHITVEMNADAVAAAQLSVQARLRSLMTLIRSRS